jgi:hypothetical protein
VVAFHQPAAGLTNVAGSEAAAVAADMSQRPAEAKRIVVKLGTSSLTSGDGIPDRQRLQRITEQVLSLYRSGVQVVIVSSGAIPPSRRRQRSGSAGSWTSGPICWKARGPRWRRCC